MMDALFWLLQSAVPLIGWFLLSWSLKGQSRERTGLWYWDPSFTKNFFRTGLLALVQWGPEDHSESLRARSFPRRERYLFIAMRSLSFCFIFAVSFYFLQWIPVPVMLAFGWIALLILFWSKSVCKGPLAVLGLVIFGFGYESLLRTSSQLIRVSEPGAWVYLLADSSLAGVFMGVGLGLVIRFFTRMTGVSWWMGLNLLTSGILSLGGAWGLILGDFIMGLIEDFRKSPGKAMRIRLGLGLLVAILACLFNFHWLFAEWGQSLMKDQFSFAQRSSLLAPMSLSFFAVETLVAMSFFHFYFRRTGDD